uniref:CMP/dCMP-type deaminase domain-containing protein n=1 Tax=viral metagenome TaxID=1070528 RepID=A0A6C0DPH2_9ZZZZ
MDNIEKELMQKACELARLSVENGGGPFGCVITDAMYNIIAEGNNQVTQTNDPTAHAEIVTIRKACQSLNTFDLSSCKLFTSCEPCPMCLSAIYWSRITDIYYSNTRRDAKDIGFDDEFIYDEISKNISDRTVKLKKVESDNSLDSFNTWEKTNNKIPY